MESAVSYAPLRPADFVYFAGRGGAGRGKACFSRGGAGRGSLFFRGAGRPSLVCGSENLHLQYNLISNHLLYFEGNVYIGDQPVCDDGFGSEEARVACRS